MGGSSAKAKGGAPLAAAVAALEAHRAALDAERDLIDERDRAIVWAIRAGARLEEAAKAAGISRAAVSKAARRTLPSRTGRGGPYARRRGTSEALNRLAEVTGQFAAARSATRQAKTQRDKAIAHAVASGAGVSKTARAVGLTPASVSVIARSSGESQATSVIGGAVASRKR
jgi:transposase